MKLLLFYRMAFITALAVASPFPLLAAGEIDKPVRHVAESVLFMFQDSTASSKKAETKPQETPQKPPQYVQDERIKEAERRAIKQVPRSIPKLKPQPVTGGVKIRRPPMKVPKKGLGGYRF